MNIPPRVIDLGLSDYVEIPSRKTREKLIEREHEDLHKRGISHIHLDGTLDTLGDSRAL